MTTGRLYQQIRQLLQAAPVFGQLDDQVKTPVAFHNLGHTLTLDHLLQRPQQRARRHPITRCLFVVDANLDLRDQHLLFNLQISDARDVCQP